MIRFTLNDSVVKVINKCCKPQTCLIVLGETYCFPVKRPKAVLNVLKISMGFKEGIVGIRGRVLWGFGNKKHWHLMRDIAFLKSGEMFSIRAKHFSDKEEVLESRTACLKPEGSTYGHAWSSSVGTGPMRGRPAGPHIRQGHMILHFKPFSHAVKFIFFKKILFLNNEMASQCEMAWTGPYQCSQIAWVGMMGVVVWHTVCGQHSPGEACPVGSFCHLQLLWRSYEFLKNGSLAVLFFFLIR